MCRPSRLRRGRDSKEEVIRLIQEAIEFHIEGLKEEGESVPPPSSSVEFVEVAA